MNENKIPWKITAAECRSPSINRNYYSWTYVEAMMQLMGDRIEDTIDTFDAIVGIQRGGLIPAVVLSNRFNKLLIVIDPFNFDATELPSNVLFVDDVVDTNKTLDNIENELLGHDINYKFITMVKKPWSSPKVDSIITTEFWIVLPWEKCDG